MLCLTRRLGDVILIDGGIEITVIRIEQGHVRLGITAPKNIAIIRKELLPRPESEQKPPIGIVERDYD